jgi:phospholipid/cholesterol/gamma-HCH transport system ATP-binding protein
LPEDGPLPPAVVLNRVSKSFEGHRVLDDLSLAVERGEHLVIVGLSGSGKSVLMEHIVGFQRPDSGRVRILNVDLDEDVPDSTMEQIRTQIGMVFQGSALIDSLTSLENVMLPLTSRGVSLSDAQSRAELMLKSVGLSPSEGSRFPAQMSGGMQKRLGIARALITEPAILLYDEPTTGLDAATSTVISRLMRRVQHARPQLASITITHDYLSAGVLADRVLYLNRETGRLDDVLASADIQRVREQHGGETRAAVAVIRERLEAFFEQIVVRDHSSASRSSDMTWGAAFTRTFTAGFHTLGESVLLLARVGMPSDLTALTRRLYEIGFQSLAVAAAAGAFFGMMLSLQIGLGLSETGVFDPLPRIIGSAIVDKVGPLVTGLLLAGRISASLSAEIGGKRLSRQFDALRAMAISPVSYWLSPLFWASVFALPVLNIVVDLNAFIGAYCVAVFRYQVKGSFFLKELFLNVTLGSFLFGLLRAAVFGGAVALIGYTKGAEEKRSSDDVGRATTLAVVAASLAVIVLDFVMTFVASF